MAANVWQHGVPPPKEVVAHLRLQACATAPPLDAPFCPPLSPLRSALPAHALAAFAGHTVLSALFPWRFSKLDKAIKPLVADLDAAQVRVCATACDRCLWPMQLQSAGSTTSHPAWPAECAS